MSLLHYEFLVLVGNLSRRRETLNYKKRLGMGFDKFIRKISTCYINHSNSSRGEAVALYYTGGGGD